MVLYIIGLGLGLDIREALFAIYFFYREKIIIIYLGKFRKNDYKRRYIYLFLYKNFNNLNFVNLLLIF